MSKSIEARNSVFDALTPTERLEATISSYDLLLDVETIPGTIPMIKKEIIKSYKALKKSVADEIVRGFLELKSLKPEVRSLLGSLS